MSEEILKDDDRRKILRVVEIDPQRLTNIDAELTLVKREQEHAALEATSRTRMMEKLEEGVIKLDEAIRGNGKEGLNQRMAKLETKVDEVLHALEDAAAFAANMNTSKFRTIAGDEIAKQMDRFKTLAREEVEKALAAPGGWMEFRKSWLFPILLSVILGIVGAYLGSHYTP